MITKLGKEIVKSESGSSGPNLLSAGESLAGAKFLHNAFSSGDLTGRATLYHGTDNISGPSIRKNGLMPTTEESAGVTKILKKDPERFQKSLGKSYMTRNKLMAANYALTRKLLKGSDKMDIVKLNTPLWKMKQVMNPEVDMPFEEWQRHSVPPEMKSQMKEWPGALRKMVDVAQRGAYNQMRKDVVIDGPVGPEFVRGSANYKGNSLGEIAQYLKARPKTFAKGTLKGLAGLGALAHGGWTMFGRNLANSGEK